MRSICGATGPTHFHNAFEQSRPQTPSGHKFWRKFQYPFFFELYPVSGYYITWPLPDPKGHRKWWGSKPPDLSRGFSGEEEPLDRPKIGDVRVEGKAVWFCFPYNSDGGPRTPNSHGTL